MHLNPLAKTIPQFNFEIKHYSRVEKERKSNYVIFQLISYLFINILLLFKVLWELREWSSIFLFLDFLFSFIVNTVYAGTFMEITIVLIRLIELPMLDFSFYLRVIRVLLLGNVPLAECRSGRMLFCLLFSAARCNWRAGWSRPSCSCILERVS